MKTLNPNGELVDTVKKVAGVLPDSAGNVPLNKANVGLGNVDNTADANKSVHSAKYLPTGIGGELQKISANTSNEKNYWFMYSKEEDNANGAKKYFYAVNADKAVYATSAGSAVDQTARDSASAAQTTASAAQTTANAAMPKTGGTFTGNVIAYGENKAGSVIRNIRVRDASKTNVATNYIVCDRK